MEKTILDRKLMIYTAGATAAALIGANSAQASIVYTPGPFAFNVDSVLDSPSIDFDTGSGNDEFTVAQERQVAGNNQTDRVIVKDFQNNGSIGNGYVVTAPGAFPSALAAGAPIGPSQVFDSNGFTGNASNQLVDEDFDNNGTFEGYSGNFTPDNIVGNTQYIGVRFRLNDNAFDDLRYGWIGIDIRNQADLTGVVTGYAYETTADTPIAAGAGVPEPSSLALLALGAVGLLKRRKQTA